MRQEIQCTEIWGGTGACDISVQLAGLRGECYSQPYKGEVRGGDIYFLSICGMSILSKVVLADVSGHGAESVEVSDLMHRALGDSIQAHDNSTMLSLLNDASLNQHRGEFKFTTMAALILDSRDRSLVYAYAGHPSILRGERATGRFRPLKPQADRPGNFPLGILPGTEFEQQTAQLEHGDLLVLYTDAFTEARRPGGDFLGEEGLVQMLDSAGTFKTYELKERLLGEVGGKLNDDASLLVLEVE
ncbi:MAG: PP2C family protein-serine/threonine phosphatase [Planctomycetota bacterium]|jgi:sigma-B regulation protein RsbU (phosphoserine phosphatase)